VVSAAALAATASSAQAQLLRWGHGRLQPCQPCQPSCIEELTKPPVVIDPKDKDKQPKTPPEVVPEPTLEPITTAALGDSFTGVPHIMGDFFGYCAERRFFYPVTKTTRIVPAPVDPPPPPTNGGPNQPPPPPEPIVIREQIFREVILCDPIVSRAGSGFKVADNASPKPQDRVFFTYNYFDNLRGIGGSAPASVTTRTIPDVATVTTTVPGVLVAGRGSNVHRELVGFEKTFLDGDASIELRAPVFQSDGPPNSFAADGFGDLTVIGKYAFLNDPFGNVFSTGLAITAPTGPAINTVAGDINSVLWQPYFGYIARSGNLYFQGIHSVVIPTDSNDVTLLFNDLGVGYIIPTMGQGLAFVAPNFECHVTTPLDDSPVVFVSDIVTLTGGVHLGLGQGNTLLSIGVATPVTGPRPMDIEAFAQLNFRF
jgi:hypothetical protein